MSEEARAWWPEGHDADDWKYAFDTARWYRAGAPGEPTDAPYTQGDIAEVKLWHVSYHGVPFTPGATGTELTLQALIRFTDGTYGALDAGNDYTGWGCGENSDMRIGTRQAVIRNGMSNEMRRNLGLAPGQAGAR